MVEEPQMQDRCRIGPLRVKVLAETRNRRRKTLSLIFNFVKTKVRGSSGRQGK